MVRQETPVLLLTGYLGSGKTTLAESLLFVSKAIAKKGEVEKWHLTDLLKKLKSLANDVRGNENERQSAAKLQFKWL